MRVPESAADSTVKCPPPTNSAGLYLKSAAAVSFTASTRKVA